MEMMNMFTVTFDQFNSSLPNKILPNHDITFSKGNSVEYFCFFIVRVISKHTQLEGR